MRLNKEITKSPVFISLIIIGIIATGMGLVQLILNSKTEQVIEKITPIEMIPINDYDFTKLSGEERLKYEDDNYISLFGIDVAAHQETIDWEKVKNDGVEFAYIRIGYRSAEKGILNVDLEFENNYESAKNIEMPIGLYWYAQPANEKESYEEAKFVINLIKDKEFSLPIVYDFEETELSDGTLSRMHGMSKDDRTKMAKIFCEELKNNGYDVMIYTNLYWADNYYDLNELKDYPLWIAQYAKTPTFKRPFAMWQYSESGHIDGIEHKVDLDLLFIRKNDQNK